MRLYSTNGYNVEIDSLQIEEQPTFFNIDGITNNLVIPAGDSVDFDVTYEPRGSEGNEYNNIYLFYSYSDYPNLYAEYFDLYLEGEAEPDYPQAAVLSVVAGSTIIPNDGTISFGSAPANGGVKNLIVSLKNSGVDLIMVDTITFSNPAFSMMEWEDMYSNFYVWYEYTSDLLLYFNPDEAVITDGTMTIESNDPTHPTYVVNLTGTGTTGIGEAEIGATGVFPNPATEIVRILTGTDMLSKVLIYNAAGAIVYNEMVENNQSIDISAFESGIYVVNIQNEQGNSVLKLIKQ